MLGVDHLLVIIEFLGTFAFAISGIRQAAGKNFDWFGGFICGIAVAIGGGTIRDVLLGVRPFWMTAPIYIICTFIAQLFVVVFSRYIKKLDNAWFVFDTLGLAFFTIAGMQKTLAMGHPFWVAIIMGTITGSAGGVIRDVSCDIPEGDICYGKYSWRFLVLADDISWRECYGFCYNFILRYCCNTFLCRKISFVVA